MTSTHDVTRPARVFATPKVPEVLGVFWVIKLLTTGLGETASDFMGTHSILLAGAVGAGGFLLAMCLQLRAGTYHPVRYWATVLMVAVFGTMIADGPHVALGTPYYVDSALYLALLVALLTWWRRTEGTLSVHSITTARRERFYWGTVLLTFGLGTALGDTTAEDLHLGFAWSILVFGGLMLVPLAVWSYAGRNRPAAATPSAATVSVATFWAAYSLTRPLGASIADWTATRHGLGWGTGPVSLGGLVLFGLLVTYVAVTHRDVEGARAARRHRATTPLVEPAGALANPTDEPTNEPTDEPTEEVAA